MLLLCVTAMGILPLWAQSIGPSSVNAAGNAAVIAGNTHEYAIGGLTVHTYTGPGLVVTQDVLQPAAQTIGINDKDFFAGSLNIFPNPAEETLFLQPAFPSGGKLSYSFYDAMGRVMEQTSVQLSTGKEKQSISLKGLAASTYMLHISYEQRGKTYNTSYKVQKIN